MPDTEASALLRPLRELAAEGRFDAIAHLRCIRHGKAVDDYLDGRLFALIINNHPPFLEDQTRAANWSQARSAEWVPRLARAASDPRRLPALVEAMLAEMRHWQPEVSQPDPSAGAAR